MIFKDLLGYNYFYAAIKHIMLSRQSIYLFPTSKTLLLLFNAVISSRRIWLFGSVSNPTEIRHSGHVQFRVLTYLDILP